LKPPRKNRPFRRIDPESIVAPDILAAAVSKQKGRDCIHPRPFSAILYGELLVALINLSSEVIDIYHAKCPHAERTILEVRSSRAAVVARYDLDLCAFYEHAPREGLICQAVKT
jgi:hypothetical protein